MKNEIDISKRFCKTRFKTERIAKKNSIYKLKVSHYKSCLEKKKFM